MEVETKKRNFEKHLAKLRGKALARHAYAKKHLRDDVAGICLWEAGGAEGKHPVWYVVTPGFPYDPGAWRVSIWDEAGPVGHYGDDVFGRPFMDVWHALHHVLMEHPRSRLSEYVLPSGEHVRLGPGPGCPA